MKKYAALGAGLLLLPFLFGTSGSQEFDRTPYQWWGVDLDVDGAQCAAPAATTVNSLPMTTVICTDSDASTLYGKAVMPDTWDGGTVQFQLWYVQTAADTAVLNGDVSAACRSAGDTINTTFGTEVAMDDAAVTGSSGLDQITSGVVTPNGTCAAGGMLLWRWQMDATGTTTAVATLHFLGMKLIE